MGAFFGSLTFTPDGLAVALTAIACVIGSLAVVFSVDYMKGEAQLSRYYTFVLLFIGAMAGLVLSGSLLFMFFFWEITALCSYALISFYNDDPKAVAGGIKALIITQVGGVGLLAGALITYASLGTYQVSALLENAGTIPANLLAFVAFGFLIAAAAKSAQFPFHTWLPDAMEAPTPISALIHAATMVNAGVYLLARFYPAFVQVPGWALSVTVVGMVSALITAFMALTATDLKRALAYSTVSQLGYMVYAIGVGGFFASQFHLLSHAVFKALLFLAAGSVILGLERGHHAHAHHAAHDEKPKAKKTKKEEHGHGGEDHGEVFDPGDMRNMGGLRKTMPVTFWLYIIGTLALAGIFPFAGFWSKDEILLDASLHYPVVYWLLTIAAFFTAFYMGRQIWMVFFGEARSDAAKHAEESPKVMTVPLMVLAVLSVAGGALNLPFEGFHNLGHWLGHTLGEVEGLPLNLQVAGISTALALIAILISWFIYGRNSLKAGQVDPLKKPLGFVFTGMENKWFVDEGYFALIINPFKKASAFLADVIDWRFWHDFVHETIILGAYNWISNIALNEYTDQKGIDAFANWLGSATQWISGIMRKIQNGFVRSYALSVLMGVVLILGYLIFK